MSTGIRQEVPSKSRQLARLAAFLFMSATTSGLAYWQFSRYYWKKDLIKLRKEELDQVNPRQLNDLLEQKPVYQEQKDPMMYVKAKGILRTDAAMWVGPRTPPPLPQKNTGGGVSAPSGRQGFYLCIPLELENHREFILVNYGWVELPSRTSKHQIKSFQPPSIKKFNLPRNQMVEFDAILRQAEKGGRFAPPNQPEKNSWKWFEMDKMIDVTSSTLHQTYGLSESLMLDALQPAHTAAETNDASKSTLQQSTTQDSFMRKSLSQYSEFYVEPPTHLGYAATWSLLSVASAFMSAKMWKAIPK